MNNADFLIISGDQTGADRAALDWMGKGTESCPRILGLLWLFKMPVHDAGVEELGWMAGYLLFGLG